MANTIVEQNREVATIQRAHRIWVMGLLACAVASVGLGLWLAVVAADMPARPWMGVAFVVAMGLALVVGASKTSSA